MELRRVAQAQGRKPREVDGVSREPDAGGADSKSTLRTLLETAEELAQMGSWEWDLETGDLRWSDNLYRLLGLEPGEITPTQGAVTERTHPDDRERMERFFESARRDGGLLQAPEHRLVRPDGVVRHMRSRAVFELSEGRRRLVGSVQDVTDQHAAERTIAAHLAVFEALSTWQKFEQGATGLLRNLALALECLVAVMWVPEGDVLVARITCRPDATDVSELESVIRQLRLPRGIGLAGQVWESADPRSIVGLEDDPRFSAEAVAGLRGALALPAVQGEEVLAVLEFYCSDTLGADVTDRLLRSLTGIGYELGEFLARRRSELKPSVLTPRELEVLQLAAQGCSGREIAERLVVSPATVRTHFEHIYEKYGVSDRAAAVAKALREGLIE